MTKTYLLLNAVLYLVVRTATVVCVGRVGRMIYLVGGIEYFLGIAGVLILWFEIKAGT